MELSDLSEIESKVLNQLQGVVDPELGSDIVDLGMVKGVDHHDDGHVLITVALTTSGCPLRAQIQRDIHSKLSHIQEITKIKINWTELTQDEKSDVIGTNLGARSPGSILNLLYNQATNNSLFRINKFNTNSLLKSIEDICKKNNVEIQTDKKVEKINISNQSVNSVLLNTGEQIETSAIISNLDPKTTYLELVGASNLDTDFIRRTNNYRTRGTVAKVNIEFKNDIQKICALEKCKCQKIQLTYTIDM